MASSSAWSSSNPGLKDGRWLAPQPATSVDNQHVQRRLQIAEQTNALEKTTLNDMTGDAFEQYEARHFSAVAKANLSDVDWRVPRLMYDKDPKYNRNLVPLFQQASNPQEAWQRYHQVQLAKCQEASQLENELSAESIAQWRQKLEPNHMSPPPMEVTIRPGCPFTHVHPDYRREGDIWERKLELRTLDEAMRGDVTKPMPRPVLFASDFENFQEGRYLKDDCPVA